MSEHEPPRAPDGDGELRLEVTPLDSRSRGTAGGGPRPPARVRRRLWLPLLTVGALLLVLAIVLGSVTSLRDAVSARFAAPTATPHLARVGPQLGSVPTNCPPGNPVASFSPDYPPGVGVSGLDVWLVGFTGPNATLQPGFEPTADGYPATLHVLVGPDVTRPLTLTISGVDTTNGDIDSTAPLTTFSIDPKILPLATDGYRSWRIQFSLPVAGCYYLGVSGSSGTFFTAGA